MSKDATPQTVPCLVLPQPYAARVVAHQYECIAWPKKPPLRHGRTLIQSAGPRPGPGDEVRTPRQGGILERQPEAILGEVEVTQIVRASECQLVGAGNKWAILFRNPRIYLDPVPQTYAVPWRIRNIAPAEVADEQNDSRTPAAWATWVQGIRDGRAADEASRRGQPMD